MKHLTLIRHAKSSWQDSGLSDFERPLNERGRRDAPIMGQRLEAVGFRPDRLVSSSAKRALETAQTIAREIDYPTSQIETVEALYGATSSQLLEAVQQFDPQFQHVALVSHNPGLTDLCNLLSESLIDNLPTCAVVRLKLHTESWSGTAPGCASQLDLDFPKREKD